MQLRTALSSNLKLQTKTHKNVINSACPMQDETEHRNDHKRKFKTQFNLSKYRNQR